MYCLLSLLVLLPGVLAPDVQPAADLKALQGEWELVAESLNGSPVRPPRGSYLMVVDGRKVTMFAGKEMTSRWEVTLDPAREPKWMDEKADGKSLVAIYRLTGDTLNVAFRNCWNDPARPTDFEPRDGVGIYILVRKKP